MSIIRNIKNKFWIPITQELSHLETDLKSLRSFAWIVGGIFLALGVLASRKHGWSLNIMSGIGLFLIILIFVRPAWLRPLYLFWMGLGLGMGLIVAPLMFALLYFIAVTPIAILTRIFGKKFLIMGFQDGSSTYWLVKPKKENRQKNAENQF